MAHSDTELYASIYPCTFPLGSQKQFDLFLWLVKINMNDLSSADAMDTLTERNDSSTCVALKPSHSTAPMAVHFTLTIKARSLPIRLSQEFGNPKVRFHHFYAENNGRYGAHAYQTNHWVKEVSDDPLTPWKRHPEPSMLPGEIVDALQGLNFEGCPPHTGVREPSVVSAHGISPGTAGDMPGLMFDRIVWAPICSSSHMTTSPRSIRPQEYRTPTINCIFPVPLV
ncbi:hypothetical protein NMY22_g10519 [Coprinellus aureogranulatus]|nr:hypothetical protein NMY22_g10519 [Coprinellus aureogranulatus]